MIAYTTAHECAFLDNIGKWNEREVFMALRSKLLVGYLMGVPKRKDWGDISRDIVKKHAEDLLKAAVRVGI